MTNTKKLNNHLKEYLNTIIQLSEDNLNLSVSNQKKDNYLINKYSNRIKKANTILNNGYINKSLINSNGIILIW